MPPVERPPTLKERVALRREVIQALEAASGFDAVPQWVSIFRELEPLLGPPTIDLQSDSPGGRSGSWIHEILARAVDRPTPNMLSVASGLLSEWIGTSRDNPEQRKQWAMLAPPLPVMETWRPDLMDRFDFLIIDATRKMLEESIAVDHADTRKSGKPVVKLAAGILKRTNEHKDLADRSMRHLIKAASILDNDMCAPLQPPAERHFTHAIRHLRLQVAAMTTGATIHQDLAHPQHLPAAFRFQSDTRGTPTNSIWKTGACSIIDCFEHSRLLRAHILTTRGAFDHWSSSLVRALNDLPPDQSTLPLKRIEVLAGHAQIRDRPEFVAALKQTVMLNITPVAASPEAPRVARRF